MALNEVSRINAAEVQGQTDVSFHLKERPLYRLDAIDESHIRLTFHDTHKAAAFEKNIPDGGRIAVSEVQDPVALKLDITLQKSISKIETSWVEDRKLLYINISASETRAASPSTPQNKTSLQDIRFGFIEKGTRMVMKMGGSTAWGIEFSGPSSFLLHLEGVSDGLKKEKFGPVKRIKEINISGSKDKGTDISVGLESSLIRLGLFRMADEERMVLDIMDEAGVTPDVATASNVTAPSSALSNEEKAQTREVVENRGNYLRMKINKADSSPVNEASMTSVPSAEPKAEAADSKNAVQKNDAGETTPTKQEGEAGGDRADEEKTEKDEARVDTADEDKPVKIEPRLNDSLPISAEMKKAIDGLDPEEAFLYGRIKQAMDIKDYQKGIDLINQFVKELPNSTLIEDIMFMKGDLYYLLWKNGDNELIGNVVSSYQKAIDRFPESKSVPAGYIKMAQAQSLKEGGEYLALGYLGLVITQKKESGLMPLAYLTRGKIFLRINQPEKAVEDFKLILEKYSRSGYEAEAEFWISNYYHTVGRYEDAEKTLGEVLDSNPEIYVEYPEYLFLRAKNYLYLKDYDHAREYLFKAVNIGRQQEGADMLLTRIGDTYHNQDKEKEAEKYYRMVVDYYPGTDGASIAKLRIAGYSSDTSILDDLSKQTTNESIGELAILEKGYQLYDKSNYAGAVEAVKPILNKPVQTETRKNARSLFENASEKELSRLYQDGKYKDMTDFYASIKDLMADRIQPDTLLSTAVAYNRLKLDEEAISTFRTLNPDNLSLSSKGVYYIGLAESYMNNGDSSAARRLLEKAGEYDLAPVDKQRITKSLALLYSSDNRLGDAHMLLQSLLGGEKLLPDDEITGAYILSARILNKQKKYAEAEKTINSIPGMPDRIKGDSLMSAYMELGKACYGEGHYPKAVIYYQKGFDLGYGADNKDYWDLKLNLAQAYANAGQLNKAETLLTEISEGGDSVMQQRAQLQLGSMSLEKQLKRLPLNKN